MGDADPSDVHFAWDVNYWNRNQPQMAFPPYWFFSSASVREFLAQRIKAACSVGVHVPVSMPADPMLRPVDLRSVDLFTRPSELRTISAH